MRMKTTLTAFITAASLTVGAHAIADEISTDSINLNNAPLYYGSPVTGTFSILDNNGFYAIDDVVTDVIATFAINDGTDVLKYISFDLSGDLAGFTYSTGSRGGYAFTMTPQGTDVIAIQLALADTGELNYSVGNTNALDTQSYYNTSGKSPSSLESAMLTVYWYDPPPSVPDGGPAITLLGMALLGISAAARKFGFSK